MFIANSDFLSPHSIKVLAIILQSSAFACLTSNLPIMSASHWPNDLNLPFPGFSRL